MIKKVEGIVVSTVNYKESSKILNILTNDQGLIGVMARGSRNIKSKISATSNVLCYGYFHLNYQKESLPTLIEVDIIDSFKNIRKDIIQMNYSLFLLELTSKVFQHSNHTNIYSLLILGITKINEGFDPRIITNIIELKFLEYLGIKPMIEKCVCCGNSHDILTISSYRGGYLCKKCVGNEYIYHLKTVGLIRLFFYVDLKKISKINISDVIKKELSLFIADYYDRYAGLYLRSKVFLEEFQKLDDKNTELV